MWGLSEGSPHADLAGHRLMLQAVGCDAVNAECWSVEVGGSKSSVFPTLTFGVLLMRRVGVRFHKRRGRGGIDGGGGGGGDWVA